MFCCSNPTAYELIDEIYERNKDLEMPDIADVAAIIRLVDGAPTLQCYRNRYVYDFLCDIIHNIQTGKWTILPYMWINVIKDSKDDKMSIESEMKAKKLLDEKVDNLLASLKVSRNTGNVSRVLALAWMRGDLYGFEHTGFHNMIVAAKAYADMKRIFEDPNPVRKEAPGTPGDHP